MPKDFRRIVEFYLRCSRDLLGLNSTHFSFSSCDDRRCLHMINEDNRNLNYYCHICVQELMTCRIDKMDGKFGKRIEKRNVKLPEVVKEMDDDWERNASSSHCLCSQGCLQKGIGECILHAVGLNRNLNDDE